MGELDPEALFNPLNRLVTRRRPAAPRSLSAMIEGVHELLRCWPVRELQHVRVLVLWREQILLVQHHDPREGVTFWMPPGGGSRSGESAEEAATREVREETGLQVRISRELAVPSERGYRCYLAELAGPPEITPEIEGSSDEIYTVGASWHPVTVDQPLGPLEPTHWSELADVIAEELRRGHRLR